MKSQTGLQTIAIQILSDISRTNGSEAIKFGNFFSS